MVVYFQLDGLQTYKQVAMIVIDMKRGHFKYLSFMLIPLPLYVHIE